jgi:outer membrane protein OmpA-like peptidoglycan-associated protein
MNLVDLIGQEIPGGTIEKLGEAAGVAPEVSEPVFRQSSTILSAGLAQAGATEGGAQRILDTAREYQAESLLDHVETLAGSTDGRASLLNKGSALLSRLFGSNADEIAAAVTRETQVPTAGTRSLLTMLAPLALGALARHARVQKMDARGLSTFLGEQRTALTGLLPSGVAELIRPRAVPVSQLGQPVEEKESPHEPEGGKTARRRTGLFLLLFAAIALVGWLISRGHRQPSMQTPPEEALSGPPAATNVPPGATNAPPAAPNEVAEPAPSPSYGFNPVAQGLDALAAYADQEGAAVAPRWFELGSLNFENGTDKFAPGSDEDIGKLAHVLQQHPDMRIQIVGHTNVAAQSIQNDRLPLARANALKTALVDRGIASNRIETMEPTRPFATDRSVDVVVLTK